MRRANFATGLLIAVVSLVCGSDATSHRASGAEPIKVAAEVVIATGFQEEPNAVALSPDGKYVIAEGGGTKDNLAIWEVATKKKLATFSKRTGGILALAVAPDGKTFAHSDYVNILICELPSGKQLRVLKRAPSDNYDIFLHELSYTRNGELLVIASDRHLLGYNPNTAERLFEWEGDAKCMSTMSKLFSNDTRIATSNDQGEIKIWNMATGTWRKLDSKITEKISTLTVSPNGKWLAAVPIYGKIEIYDVESGKQKRVLDADGGWREAVFLHDNVSLAYSTRVTRYPPGPDRYPYIVENVETGQQTHLLHGHSGDCEFGSYLLPDGSKLVTASADRTISIWNVKKLP